MHRLQRNGIQDALGLRDDFGIVGGAVEDVAEDLERFFVAAFAVEPAGAFWQSLFHPVSQP